MTEADPARGTDPRGGPWRCPVCRHDVRGSELGARCPECGAALDERSVLPSWIDGAGLARLRRAARVAAATTVGLAAFPFLAAGVPQLLPSEIRAPVVLGTYGLAVLAAIGAQTRALLLLARSPVDQRSARRFAVLIPFRALLFVAEAAAVALALPQSLSLVYQGGAMDLGASVSRDPARWLAVLVLQFGAVAPAAVCAVALTRTIARLVHLASDDRPAWRLPKGALAALSWIYGLAGLLFLLPLAGPVLGPLLWLGCDVVLFASIARACGLRSGGRR